jgi:hypothetical protein
VLRFLSPALAKHWIVSMTGIVAERLFRESNSGARVTARLFLPERSEGDWSCRIEVQGLSVPFETSIFGVDSFQALAGGMRVLCAYLEKHEACLAFLDGPPGDCALPLIASCDPPLRAEVHEFIRSKIEHDPASRR